MTPERERAFLQERAGLAMLCLLLQPACSFAEGIDTEHIYGFMIGSDVGDAGEREFQTTTTGRFSKQAGNYQALDQQLEMEFVPFKNFRIEVGTTFAAYDIAVRSGLGGSDRGRLAGSRTGFTLPVSRSGNGALWPDPGAREPRKPLRRDHRIRCPKLRNRADACARAGCDPRACGRNTQSRLSAGMDAFVRRSNGAAGINACRRVRDHGASCAPI